MKITLWNVRVLNASDKRAHIKKQIDMSGADVVLLQEMKLSNQSYQNTIAKWNRWQSIHIQPQGASGGLCILWNPKCCSISPVQYQPN